jgi:FHA domain
MTAGFHAALATTGYSGAIRIVQWCVIALIFLFFLRVIRAVWVEVRPAGPRQARSSQRAVSEQRVAAEPPPRRGKAPLYLEVVEPSDRAGQRFELDEEVTIGRSPGSAIATTYDIYSSTLHARVFRHDGRVYVEDLGSTNGTFVNSERIVKATKLGRGDLLQIGATVFQVTR